jgi:hypothetical protein
LQAFALAMDRAAMLFCPQSRAFAMAAGLIASEHEYGIRSFAQVHLCGGIGWMVDQIPHSLSWIWPAGASNPHNSRENVRHACRDEGSVAAR